MEFGPRMKQPTAMKGLFRQPKFQQSSPKSRSLINSFSTLLYTSFTVQTHHELSYT
jgi:hypothetical protein